MIKPYKKIFHYTTRQRLRSILRSGAILSRRHAGDAERTKIPDVVWMSHMTPWDPIAVATLDLEPERGLQFPAGAVPGKPFEAARVGVARRIATQWDDWLSTHGGTWMMIMELGSIGEDYRSRPRAWWVCPDPLPADKWLGVELWDGNSWQRVPRRGRLYAESDLDSFLEQQGCMNGTQESLQRVA